MHYVTLEITYNVANIAVHSKLLGITALPIWRVLPLAFAYGAYLCSCIWLILPFYGPGRLPFFLTRLEARGIRPCFCCPK